MEIAGMTVLFSSNLTEQFRFPRTKKRRIRNKWAARSENRRPSTKILYDGQRMIAHPCMEAALRNAK
jgi:hypothetical protein